MDHPALASLGYWVYTGLSMALSPGYALQLAVRHARGLEPTASTYERLGGGSVPRPKGPVLWFHALSIGESAVALPVIFRCLLEYNENVHVLLTTGTPEAHSLLASSLPRRVIVQYVPFESPLAVARFLRHWRPQVGLFMESPAWPILVEGAAAAGVRLGLLNARMSSSSFLKWFMRAMSRALLSRLLSHFALIVPQSDVDVGRFRILGATLAQMPGWCSDLKYAAALGTSVWHLWRPSAARILGVKRAVAGRPLWVAASTHDGEELLVAGCHKSLLGEWPDLLTFLVPRQSSRCGPLLEELRAAGLAVGLWSECVEGEGCRPLEGLEVVLVDIIPDLPLLYSVSEIAFIGNSLLEGCSGHNLAEAAVAGCAVLTGPHAGAFTQMAEELNQAAVLAAEEAAAAVNSSGPLLEEAFAYAAEAAGGGGPEGAASPRDATHWRGVLDGTHHAAGGDRSGTAGGSGPGGASTRQVSGAGAGSSAPASRPATAPAAVAYSGTGGRGGGGGSWRPAHGSSTSLSLLSEGSSPRLSGDGYAATAPFRRSDEAHRLLETPGGPPPSATTNTPATNTATATPLASNGEAAGGFGRAPLESADAELLQEGVLLEADTSSSGASSDSDTPELRGTAEAAAVLLGQVAGGQPGAGGRRRARPMSAGRHRPLGPGAAPGRVGVGGGGRGGTGHPAGGAGWAGGGGAVGSPLCPPTPTTPAPTPVGSAQALGGRSPQGSYPGQPSGLSHPLTWTPRALDAVAAAAAEAAAAARGASRQASGSGSIEEVQVGSCDAGAVAGRSPAAGSQPTCSSSSGSGNVSQPGAGSCRGQERGLEVGSGSSSSRSHMGRSPTLTELACAVGPSDPPRRSSSSGSSSLGEPPAATQRQAGPGPSWAPGPGAGGAGEGWQPSSVDLSPGSPCAALLAGVPPVTRQGSVGWEAWPTSPAATAAAAAAAAAAAVAAAGGGTAEADALYREATLAVEEATPAAGAPVWHSSSSPAAAAPPGGEGGEGLPLGRLKGGGDSGGSLLPAAPGGEVAAGGGVQHAPSTPTHTQAAASATDCASSVSTCSSPEQAVAVAAPQHTTTSTTSSAGMQEAPGQPQWASPPPGSSSSSSGGGGAPLRRSTGGGSMGGGGVEPSPLGDPGRAAHWTDPLPPGPRRITIPQHGTSSGAPPGATRSLAAAAAANAAAGPSGAGSANSTPAGWAGGGSSSGGGGRAWCQLVAGPSWEGGDNSDAGGYDTNAATPTSMSAYSPMSTADTATPSWFSSNGGGGGLEGSSSGRSNWRASGAFTPRLPRHEELEASSDAAPTAPSDAGDMAQDGGDTPPAAGRRWATGRAPSPDKPPPLGGAAAGSSSAACGAGGGGRDAGLVGTSYLRYRGEYILPATHLPHAPTGPAVWRVAGAEGLTTAVASLLREPLERRSRGHAAAQAAAKLASGLVSTVWHVVDDMVITPALQAYVTAQGAAGGAASTAAPRVPGHPRF